MAQSAVSAVFSSERLFFKYDLICFIIHMNMVIQKLTALLNSMLLLSENNLEMVSMYLKLGFQCLYYYYYYYFICSNMYISLFRLLNLAVIMQVS